MTKTHQYIDGVDQVVLIDGIVRFELVGISQINDGKADIHRAGGLAMSIQGFLRMHEQMTRVVNKMVEQGIVKKNSPTTEPSALKLDDTPNPSSTDGGRPRRK